MTPFEILNLESSATKADVRLRWRTLAKIHHPDKGGDPGQFDYYKRAYEMALRVAIDGNLCPVCHDKGYVTVRKGFNSIGVKCKQCNQGGAK